MSIVRRSNISDPFSLDVWDPFQGLPFDAFRSLAETRPGFVSETSAFVNTRLDWKETPDAHVFKADLPGVKKEEVKVEVEVEVEVEEGRVLQISGERSKEKEEKSDKWHRVERSSGKFLRRFRLPENAKVDQVKASMENGVLTVTVPKEEAKKKPEMKSIEISSAVRFVCLLSVVCLEVKSSSIVFVKIIHGILLRRRETSRSVGTLLVLSIPVYLKYLTASWQTHRRQVISPNSSDWFGRPFPFLHSAAVAAEHYRITAMSIVRRSNIFDPFSLDVWDPFRGFPFDAFRSLSETRPGFVSETSAFANTRIDWKETPEAHVFKADLPGVKREEVKVEVEEGGVLQISGERSKEEEEKSDKWHRVERSSGKFLRRFRLPENAKVDQVKASMENGVLTVTVPKEEAKKKPEMKTIEISG
ncbi:hypothetical protein B296_00028726 [Ensete ventricosum]|uniref:SHSP domain-containing protein n=1 Tax=Ensete ventricosum TaxID=4639 RepID=A0A426Y540_ENSVE|nr:hypothetical protein B296_00028726 [Ensete ventricosum]